MQKIHEYGGFKVVKNELSKFFCILLNNPNLKTKDLELESGLGKNKIENYKYYLRNFNLLDKTYSPTELAKVIFLYDKYFEDEITLWILFYHWANKTSNPFLFFQINKSVDSKTKEDLRVNFISWAMLNEIKTQYDKKFVEGLISRTLNSFTENDAFKVLNIFILHDEKYSRGIPYKLDSLAIAYVLFDNRYERTTISFDELLKEDNNIGKIFNLNTESLQKQIYSMRDIGLIKYEQTANLHQIVYIYKEKPLKLLEKYYEQY